MHGAVNAVYGRLQPQLHVTHLMHSMCMHWHRPSMLHMQLRVHVKWGAAVATQGCPQELPSMARLPAVKQDTCNSLAGKAVIHALGTETLVSTAQTGLLPICLPMK